MLRLGLFALALVFTVQLGYGQDTIRAGFETSPVCFGEQSQFINKTYVPSALGSVNYLWKFGDGTTSTDPFGKREYKLTDSLKTQIFNVTLVVTSKTNPPDVDSVTHGATVYGLPHAYFTWEVSNDGVNQEVSIDSLAVDNADYFYQWNLGGVLKSNERRPKFSGSDLKPFLDGNNHSFSLFMRSPEGCENQYNGVFNYNLAGINEHYRSVVFASPNPAHDALVVSIPLNTLYILDMQGRTILVIEDLNSAIDISSLTSGMYTLIGIHGRDRYTQRIAVD